MAFNKLAIKAIKLWDLDGTVINSFARVFPCMDEKGNLDLNMYREKACVHDAIMTDTLLPLVEYMRASLNDPTILNIIVTARYMGKSDYYFLRKQRIRAGRGGNIQILSRDVLHRYIGDADYKEVYYAKDGIYKTHYFEMLKAEYPNATITMIDDNKGVLAAAAAAGLQTMDATAINDILSIGVRLAGESFIDEALDDDNDYQYLCERLAHCWEGMTEEERNDYGVKPQQFIQSLAIAS
ncbi:hypothetical protein pzkkv7_126 [Klebsiella phage pzk-kv7]|nr:hypothetical protein pzkkv7_126 [Klebsiella phage pzk-kv7]